MNFNVQTYFLKRGIIITFLLLGTILPGANTPDEKEKIVSVVKQFFAVLESRDVKDAQKILIPKGVSISLREEGKGETVRITNFQEFMDSFSKWKDNYKEIMSNPKVLIHNGIAVLWADYKFYVNGKFSHCGVDAFSLIKTDNNWKIAGIIYTVEKSGCDQ
jgi:hypothetical protein